MSHERPQRNWAGSFLTACQTSGPRVLGQRLLREQALVGAVSLARCAPAARRRAAPCRTTPPTFIVIAPIPDLWPRFPPSTRSGWPDGLSLSRSSRRNASRGPNSSRSRNLRFAAIPWGAVLSCCPRGRRGGCAAHGAVATGLCCGPRYAATWRSQATAISRRLAALATRPSATAPRRLWLSGRGFKEEGGRSEFRLRFQLRRDKSEIRNSGGARHAECFQHCRRTTISLGCHLSLLPLGKSRWA